ncbi:hypothetical protein ABTN13_20740, partial [Acinetobacter baumannii]
EYKASDTDANNPVIEAAIKISSVKDLNEPKKAKVAELHAVPKVIALDTEITARDQHAPAAASSTSSSGNPHKKDQATST